MDINPVFFYWHRHLKVLVINLIVHWKTYHPIWENISESESLSVFAFTPKYRLRSGKDQTPISLWVILTKNTPMIKLVDKESVGICWILKHLWTIKKILYSLIMYMLGCVIVSYCHIFFISNIHFMLKLYIYILILIL